MLSTGHEKVILQSDPEPSIIDVKHDASTHVPTEIVHEESPVAESNANGSIARAKRSIKGQIRAIKDHTERQVGATNWSRELSQKMLCETALTGLNRTWRTGSRIALRSEV